jgi:hypothetical protein
MRETSILERSFLLCLNKTLREAGCNPVILRNYEGFPTQIGNDLDIFVPNEFLELAIKILQSAVDQSSGKIAHVHRRSYFVAVWIDFPDSGKPLHIDLYPGALTWHGLEFLSEKLFLSRSQRLENGIVVPSKGDEALTLLLINILWGGSFKNRYRRRIEFLLEDREALMCFKESLIASFGSAGSFLINAFHSKDYQSIDDSNVARRLRRALRLRSFVRSPFTSLKEWTRYWLFELINYTVDQPGSCLRLSQVANSRQMSTEITDLIGPYYGAVIETQDSRSQLIIDFIRLHRAKAKNHLFLEWAPLSGSGSSSGDYETNMRKALKVRDSNAAKAKKRLR